MVPSRYALKVGDIDVLVVSDGVLPLPTAMLAHNVDPAVRAAWLKDMFLPPDAIDWALNVVAVRRGGQTILVDAGMGRSSRTCRGPGGRSSDWEAVVAGSRDGRGGPVTLGRLILFCGMNEPHGELRPYRPRPARRDGHVRRRLAATL